MAEIAGKPHLRDYQALLQECLARLRNFKPEEWEELRDKIVMLCFKPIEFDMLHVSVNRVQLCLSILSHIPDSEVFRRRLWSHLVEMNSYVSHAMLQQTIPDAKHYAPTKTLDSGSLETRRFDKITLR